jgi:hypothetical protein
MNTRRTDTTCYCKLAGIGLGVSESSHLKSSLANIGKNIVILLFFAIVPSREIGGADRLLTRPADDLEVVSELPLEEVGELLALAFSWPEEEEVVDEDWLIFLELLVVVRLSPLAIVLLLPIVKRPRPLRPEEAEEVFIALKSCKNRSKLLPNVSRSRQRR